MMMGNDNDSEHDEEHDEGWLRLLSYDDSSMAKR